jgi:hypothetical protein
LQQRLEAEQQARQAAERELAELRATLQRQPPRRGNGPRNG